VQPAFATVEQLTARVVGGQVDDGRAQAVLDDASARIRAEAVKSWVTDGELDADTPDIVEVVCLQAALRAYQNPERLTQEGIGTGYVQSNVSADVYLTKAELRLVRRAAGNSGLWTKPTTRGYLESGRGPGTDTTFMPTELGDEPLAESEPIAWTGPDGY
jgi:hypothetical protein